MSRLHHYVRPIEVLYWFDGRTRKHDYSSRCKTPHGAKRAVYLHLDKDFGDSTKAVVIDSRAGKVLWTFRRMRDSGSIFCEELNADLTVRLVNADKQEIARKLATG